MFQQNDLSFVYRYFMAEKHESLVFIIVGILSIVAGIVFLAVVKTSPQFYKGLAIPACAIGLLLGIVGYTVFARSNKQAKDVSYNIGMDANAYIKQTEQPRMEKVMKSFVLYRWIEIILTVAGIGLFFYFKNDETKLFWKGLGISLAVMALVALTADYFAEKRGAVYLKELKTLISS